MYGLSTVDPPIYGDVISGYVVESISLAFAIYIAAAAVYDVIHLKKRLEEAKNGPVARGLRWLGDGQCL